MLNLIAHHHFLPEVCLRLRVLHPIGRKTPIAGDDGGHALLCLTQVAKPGCPDLHRVPTRTGPQKLVCQRDLISLSRLAELSTTCKAGGGGNGRGGKDQLSFQVV
jgi:hypothetical protein